MRFRLDLRDVPVPELSQTVLPFSPDSLFLITAWQWSAWTKQGRGIPESSRLVVIVPDFLYYARLIGTGQARQIASLPESSGRLLKSAVACVPTGVCNLTGLAQGRFWAGAEALLAFDMGLLGRDFGGEVILHYNLTDFVWLFEKRAFMKRYIGMAGTGRTWGVATQQLSKGLSACARWRLQPSRILHTVGYERRENPIAKTARDQSFTNTQYTLDLTQWPTDLVAQGASAAFYRETDDEWLITLDAASRIL